MIYPVIDRFRENMWKKSFIKVLFLFYCHYFEYDFILNLKTTEENGMAFFSIKSLFDLSLTLGSTFKPLNPVKSLDKTKRRSRRTTIMGIPQQVQRELGM